MSFSSSVKPRLVVVIEIKLTVRIMIIKLIDRYVNHVCHFLPETIEKFFLRLRIQLIITIPPRRCLTHTIAITIISIVIISKVFTMQTQWRSSRSLNVFSLTRVYAVMGRGVVSQIDAQNGSGCFSRGGPRPTCPLEHKRTRESSFLGDWFVNAVYTAITTATLGPKACSTSQEAPASRAS